MPTHHRRRSHKDPEDEPLPPRADESHGEPYSRDYRQTSSYRRADLPSNGGRSSYDSRPSSSRTHRDSNWRSRDYHDDYSRERRDEYDVASSREHEPWPARSVPEPRYSERDWVQRYDTGHSTSSYTEHSAWEPSSHSHDHRNGHQERWQAQDNHGHTFKGRQSERTQTVDERREWTTHSSRLTGAAYGDPWNSPPEKKAVVDDRTWEPAPSWQPSGSGGRQSHRGQSAFRNDYYNKPPSRRAIGTSTHRNHNYTNNRPQKDWRSDDGNPNNWSRRQSQGSERAPLPPPTTRKHYRSTSRSRSASRSPAESYYSRRSSRGRTRSPSASPASKRQRRETSPIADTGPSSHDFSHTAWVPRQSQPLPLPTESTYKQNSASVPQRNASPTSSMGTGRSRSRSPNTELLRSSHPLSTSVSAPAIISSYSGVEDLSRTLPGRRNGTDAANGVHNKMGFRTQPPTQNTSTDAMPPPTIIPVAHGSQPSRELPRGSWSKSMAPTRILPRNTGFKPIGQNSSSLRKFFPGDEEDMDASSDLSVMADPEPQEIPPQSTADNAIERPHLENPMPSQPTVGPVNEDTSLLTSSPLAPSRGSSVVMEEEPPEPTELQTARLSPQLQTPRQLDLDTNDTGASTPSVQTRSELYAILSQVGEGTFGKVYKAQNTVTKLHVALKRIRMESEKEGFPVTAMREVKLLQSLRHENVVRLYEMMVSNGSVYMVFEYMDHDLTGILSQSQFTFTDAHLKSLCKQMLAGLAYLHHKGVIHRDIKGSNILINNRGELKLADFGLARFYQKRRRSDYTNRVITLWYRPPELLFGATIYGPEVDMWSAGCIMLELFTKKPVFQGNDEIHQLDTIYRVIGTPTPDRWSDVANLPWYELVKPRDEIPNHFRDMFRKWMSQPALDLAERLLCYDPAARATAVQALEAPYFTQEEPFAVAPAGLATLQGEWHELETKRERAKKKRKNDIAIQ